MLSVDFISQGYDNLLESEQQWANIRESIIKNKYEVLLTENIQVYQGNVNKTEGKIKSFFLGIINKIKKILSAFMEKVSNVLSKINKKILDVADKTIVIKVKIHDWNVKNIKNFCRLTTKFASETISKSKSWDADKLYKEAKENNAFARMLNKQGKITPGEFTNLVMSSFTNGNNEPKEIRYTIFNCNEKFLKLYDALDQLQEEIKHLSKFTINTLENMLKIFETTSNRKDNESKLDMVKAVYFKESANALSFSVSIASQAVAKLSNDVFLMNQAILTKFNVKK